MKDLRKILLLIVTAFMISCQGSSDTSSGCKNGSEIIVTKTKQINKFDKIKISNFSYVYYTQADSVSCIIETDDNLQGQVETLVLNKKLIIKNKIDICPSQLIIHLTSPELHEVEIAGSSNFTAQEALDTDTLNLLLTGSTGHITFTGLNANYLSAIIETSGSIKGDGKAKNIYANIKGTSSTLNDINLQDLYSKDGTAIIEGNGKISVNVWNKLKALITGNGWIYYVGDPQEKDFDVLGTGKIERLD